MNVIVAPISGGCFPVQLEEYRRIMMYIREPDIIFAGSGGSVSSYCTMASDWTPNRLLNIAGSLNTSLFVDKFNNTLIDLIPNNLINVLQGAFYKASKNSYEFMSNFFTQETIQDYEIWSGAINKETGRVGLFCNKERENSLISPENYNTNIFNSESLKYMCGNITHIVNSILASSCIPFFIEAIQIGTERYIDCGNKFASALTPLQDELRKIINDKDIHIIYLSAYNIEESSRGELSTDSSGFYDLLQRVPTHVVRGLVQQDRSVALHIVSEKSTSELNYAYCSIDCLEMILDIRNKSQSSLIEIHPIGFKGIDLFNFNGCDVQNAMLNVKLGIRIWWIGDNNLFSHINGVITHKLDY